MIARLWSARTTQKSLHPYLQHLSRNVLPELRALDGFLGLTGLTRPVDNSPGTEIEVIVTTFWRSLQAIGAFAGPNLEAAVVADEAARLLTSFDRRVRHYDLALSDFVTSPPLAAT